MLKIVIKNLVSIIMPTYNRSDIILHSVKSVLRQTYDNFELIIVDDGSTDQTKEIVSDIGDKRIRYLKTEANQGACHARNQGLAIAGGEYIAFLDSDNVWDKSYLERRMDVLGKSSKNVGGVFGYTKIIKNHKMICTVPLEEIGERILNSRSNTSMLRYILLDNIIDTNTIVLRQECVEKVSGFDESLKRLQDWEYFFRILYQSGYKIKFTADYLVTNYLRKDSISRRSNDEAYWRTRIFFLEKYKDVFEEYGCFEEAICQLCLKKDPDLNEENLYSILALADDRTLKKILALMKKKYENLNKEKERLAGIECAFTEINKKNNVILNIQSRWMLLLQKGQGLKSAMQHMGYHKIAIYGFGHLGKALYREMEGAECKVAYIIDKYLEPSAEKEVEILKPGADVPGIDAVIVTAVYEHDKIKKKYEDKTPYISLADVIDFAERESGSEWTDK